MPAIFTGIGVAIVMERHRLTILPWSDSVLLRGSRYFRSIRSENHFAEFSFVGIVNMCESLEHGNQAHPRYRAFLGGFQIVEFSNA